MSDLTDVVAAYVPDLVDRLPVAALKDFLHWYQQAVDSKFQLPPARAKRALFAEIVLSFVQAKPAHLVQFFEAAPQTVPELEANQWPFAMNYDQRRLLTATGHLPVASTRSARLYGHDVLVPAYSVLDVLQLQLLGADGRSALLAQARQEAKLLPDYQIAQAQRKQQQRDRRIQRNHLKTVFWQSVEALHQKVPPAEQPLFALAFWTQQINQVQKYWQLHTTEKSHGLADYYHLKGLAIAEFLASDDPHIKHGFYRPKQADRFDVSLCPEHFEAYLNWKSTIASLCICTTKPTVPPSMLVRCAKWRSPKIITLCTSPKLKVLISRSHFTRHTPSAITCMGQSSSIRACIINRILQAILRSAMRWTANYYALSAKKIFSTNFNRRAWRSARCKSLVIVLIASQKNPQAQCLRIHNYDLSTS